MMKQFVPQESCLKCLGCCRFSQEDSVWSPCLLNEETEVFLKRGLPASLITLDKKIRVVSFDKGSIFICSLFNHEENKCKIYDFRPFECQLYPFLINRQDNRIFLAVDLKCPFAKEKIQMQEFKDYSQYLSDLLRSPQYTEILKNNSQIIQAYPEAVGLCEI